MPHEAPSALEVLTADYLATLDDPDTYTPTLTASITNPTLGSGAIATGWWHRNGHLITGGAVLQFGTSGVAVGSGAYLISLPFAADSSLVAGNGLGLVTVLGSGSLRDNSGAASTWRTCTVLLYTGAAHAMMHVSDNSQVTNAAPWTWAASDGISINFAYLADPSGLP